MVMGASPADVGADVAVVDVAVVGAGIVGSMVAREVVERWPQASVVVLDRDIAGLGASRRSAGLHIPRGATPRVRQMAADSEKFYQELLAADPTLPIYPQRMLVTSQHPPEALRQVYLSTAELTPLQLPGGSTVGPAHWTGQQAVGQVWTGEGCHHSDVGALTTTLIGQLRPRVAVLEGLAVREVHAGADEILLGLSTGATVRAGTMVLAPGPWATQPVWHPWVAPLEVRIKKIVALHIDQRPEPGDPVLVFHDDDSFLLPVGHQRHWLFSYTCTDWDVDPDDLRGGLSRQDLLAAQDCLNHHAPGLVACVSGGRMFCDAYSPDRQPIVRAVDRHGRMIFAGAANGSGYRLAPAIAVEAADLLHPFLSLRTTP